MEHGCSEHGIRPGRYRWGEVLDRACATTGDDRNGAQFADFAHEFEVEALLCAICVDGVHEQLPRPAFDALRTFSSLIPGSTYEGPQSRDQAVESLLPWLQEVHGQGVPVKAVTRHILGLFNGLPGARAWRRPTRIASS